MPFGLQYYTHTTRCKNPRNKNENKRTLKAKTRLPCLAPRFFSEKKKTRASQNSEAARNKKQIKYREERDIKDIKNKIEKPEWKKPRN